MHSDDFRFVFGNDCGVSITHRDWPDEIMIRNRRVSLISDYSTKPFRKMCSSMERLIKTKPGSKCIVYSNTRRRVNEIKKRIGEFLDSHDDLWMHQVLCVHGRLLKVEKTGYVKMFLGDGLNTDGNSDRNDDGNGGRNNDGNDNGNDDENEDGNDDGIDDGNDNNNGNNDGNNDGNGNVVEDDEQECLKFQTVLCATSGVANVGIDSRDIRAVYRLEFPASMLDYVQESGRAGRQAVLDAENNIYTVYYSIETFLYIYERAMDPDEHCIDDGYRQVEVSDAIEVAKLLLLEKECYHIQIERYFCNPETLHQTANVVLRCGSLCPFCRGEQHFVPAINREGLTIVLFDLFNSPPSTTNIIGENKPWTLLHLVDGIQKYPKFKCNDNQFKKQGSAASRHCEAHYIRSCSYWHHAVELS